MKEILLNYYGVFIYTTTLILWIAPIKAVINLYKTNDIWQVPYNFYMVSIINCLFWVIYGLQIDVWPIWAVNIPGYFSFTGCIIVYLFFIKMKKIELLIMLVALPVKSLFLVYLFYYYVPSEITGWIAMTANLAMYLVPIESIYHVIKAKNNVYIELWLAIAVVLNTFVWFIFGILLSDNWDIIIPNGVGFFVGVVQLFVWYKFRATKGYEKVERSEIHDASELHDVNEIDTAIE